MYIPIGTPKTINQLKGLDRHTTSEERQYVQIAVIDDEQFAYLDLLQRHGFHIRHFKDIENVQDLNNYPVVLCDIKGVGKHFKSKYEGAHLISEIRKRYPSKVILAYTGHTMDPTYNKYFEMADRSLKKDISSEEWVEVLDIAIKNARDPVFQWKRLRESLLERDIALHDLCMLEDNFVAAMLKNAEFYPSAKVIQRLPPEVQAVIKDFAKSIGKQLLLPKP